MKKHKIIALLLTLNLVSQAQFGNQYEVELITFESESTYLRQGTPTTNCWQIGKPSKTMFNEAYAGTKVIMTDTLNPYPSNNHSWFDVVLPLEDFVWFYYDVHLSFYHKLDTDTLMDGAYITVSYDMGHTWQNIIDDTSGWFTETPGNYSPTEGMYTHTNNLFNNEKGFSGSIMEWQRIEFNWATIAVKKRDDFFEDTMIVRFNFISDSSENLYEGWMIDNLRLYSLDYGGNVHEFPFVSNLYLFPNPFSKETLIRTKNQTIIQKVEVFTLNGQFIKSEVVLKNEYTFQRNAIPKTGMYFLRCTFADGSMETLKAIMED